MGRVNGVLEYFGLRLTTIHAYAWALEDPTSEAKTLGAQGAGGSPNGVFRV